MGVANRFQRFRGKVLLLPLLFLCAPLRAGELSFNEAKNYPAIGMAFPTLLRSSGDPLPMPDAATYLPSNPGDTLVREDRFTPGQLWYGRVCRGRWRDPEGRLLVLGEISHLYPSLSAKHVTHDFFSKALASAKPNPRDPDEVNSWVATFANVPVYPPNRLKINKFTLDQVLDYRTLDDHLLIYAFRLRKKGSHSPDNTFCVTLKLAPSDDPVRARQDFETGFLGKIALPSRSDRDEGVKSEEIFTDRETGPRPTYSFDPIRIEARRRIENYENWWVSEGEEYMILSDVYSETGKALIRQIKSELPLIRKAATRLLPPLASLKNEVSLIRLFQYREDYLRYLGDQEMEWSAGVWMPSRRELVLYQRAGVEEMMPTIRHEAFHQYLSYATAMIPTSPWINEGHACFFEGMWRGSRGQPLFSENADRVQTLLNNLDTATALLPLLLYAPYDLFYSGTLQEKSLKYALGWGIVYFLEKGIPVSALPEEYEAIIPTYLAALKETRNYTRATERAFSKIDMESFQSAFKEFWQLKRGDALKHDPLRKRAVR